MRQNICDAISYKCACFQNGILRFCGFDVLKPELTFGLHTMTAAEQDSQVTAWERRLSNIWQEEPQTFIANSMFEENWVLSDQAVSKLLYSPGAPTVGQHLGRNLPVVTPHTK